MTARQWGLDQQSRTVGKRRGFATPKAELLGPDTVIAHYHGVQRLCHLCVFTLFILCTSVSVSVSLSSFPFLLSLSSSFCPHSYRAAAAAAAAERGREGRGKKKIATTHEEVKEAEVEDHRDEGGDDEQQQHSLTRPGLEILIEARRGRVGHEE